MFQLRVGRICLPEQEHGDSSSVNFILFLSPSNTDLLSLLVLPFTPVTVRARTWPPLSPPLLRGLTQLKLHHWPLQCLVAKLFISPMLSRMLPMDTPSQTFRCYCNSFITRMGCSYWGEEERREMTRFPQAGFLSL